MRYSLRSLSSPVLWAFILLIFLVSCNRKHSTQQNIVVAQLQSDPPSLHSCNASNGSAQYIFQYTQRTLTRIDMRSLQQIPVLVKGLAQISADGKEYTYELRDDVTWDDGSPLTVDDVIFTIKVTKCPLTDNPEQKSVYDNVYDIRRDDKDGRKFIMVAKQLYYKNANIFDELNILQKKFWDPKGAMDKISIPAMDDSSFRAENYPGLAEYITAFNSGDNGHKPERLVGLGPYKVSSWQTGSTVTLEKKSNWWGLNDTSIYNHAYPDKIIFRIISEDPAIELALKKHNLDVVTTIGTATLMKLSEDTSFTNHYNYGYTDLYSYNFIGLNTKPSGNRLPLLTDKRVRRAMAYLIPDDEIIKTIPMGKATRQASFIQPLFKDYYNDTLKLIPFDIEKAKALLTEAGWIDTDGDNIRDKVVNGKKVKMDIQLTYRSSDANKQMALMIKDAMYKAGVNLIPDPIDGNVIFKRLLDQDFDMLLSAWSGSAVPEDPEQIFHTTNWANHGYNFTGFGDAESDRLIDLSNKTIDRAARIRYLKALQAKIYEEQPYIFTYAVKRKIVISKKFENPNMYAERPGVMLNNLKLKEGEASGNNP